MAPQPEDTSDSAAVIEYLRLRLLASVAGSDRGFAVNKNQAAEIKEAAEALAAAGGPVTLVYGAEGGAFPALFIALPPIDSQARSHFPRTHDNPLNHVAAIPYCHTVLMQILAGMGDNSFD